MEEQGTNPSESWLEKLRGGLRRGIFHFTTLVLRPASLTANNRFLFILSHMRSGSTLLAHLLCSSDEIIGFGESHNTYHCRSDLAKLFVSVHAHTRKNPLQYRYVLDKLVGSDDVLSTTILDDSRTRYIFLLRGPSDSVSSIVHMRRTHYGETLERAIEFATDYYLGRLPQFVQLANNIDDPQRCLLITYEQLLMETAPTLEALTNFLHLESPLHEEYKITPNTGKFGLGDPSANIRLGRIDRSLPRKEIALTADVESRLQACYDRCVSELRQLTHCEDERRLMPRRLGSPE